MAQNLASKYSNKVAERFSTKSLTDRGLNKDYEWNGVKTVTVYSVDTATLGDYTRTGASRYGTPADLGTTKQDLTLTQDKAFTFVIDKGNHTESMMVTESGKALARQMDEVVTPFIDKYRLSVWASATNTQTTGTAVAVDKANAYSLFLTAQEKLDEAEVPQEGRICYCIPSYINLIKQDSGFIKASEIAQNLLIKGQVGEIDGVAIVKVPSNRMPLKTPFIMIKPSCSCSPMKLEDYKIHQNPPGISGWLVEGRAIFDTFVLNSTGKAIVKHMIP